MENLTNNGPAEDEEEYVLLDLDAVAGQVDIPGNAPYVLSVSLLAVLTTLIPNEV